MKQLHAKFSCSYLREEVKEQIQNPQYEASQWLKKQTPGLWDLKKCYLV